MACTAITARRTIARARFAVEGSGLPRGFLVIQKIVRLNPIQITSRGVIDANQAIKQMMLDTNKRLPNP